MQENPEKEEEKDQGIVMGNSAQDGVNMAAANAATGEGINYGQYLQVIEKKNGLQATQNTH